ncbi:MAG: C1 family peptidase [Planctomycetota bacterium]
MKKNCMIYGFVILCLTGGRVSADTGNLDEKLIEEIRSDFKMDTHTRAMYNAIANTNIRALAINRDLLREHNEFFSNKIEVKGISNQEQSGRCWLFAALNSIKYPAIKKNKLKALDFSHIYLTFWDKFEKANTFYERIIEFRNRDMMDRELVFVLRTPLPDGGYWENAKDLIKKYGLVPKEVMPETHSSNNTSVMNNIIERKMRVDAVKLREMAKQEKSIEQMREAKEKMLTEIYRLLVMNFGEPPVTFDWRYEPKDKEDDKEIDEEEDGNENGDEEYEDKSIIIENYTPKQFYDKFVGLDLDEYVDIFNDTIHPVGRRYQVMLTRNLYDGHDLDYANVDLEAMKDAAIKSLVDDTPLWFSVDVSVDQDSDKGIMIENLYDYGSIFNVDLKMTKAQLALFRENTPNHGMNLIGVDIQDEKPVKWLVENSWGSEKGRKGTWIMYDNWFDMNIYGIIIHKKYLPEDIIKIFEQKPVKLPVWDPMWQR